MPLADTHLGFFTVFDGTFEKYIGDFTEKIGPVFDLMFKYVSDLPPTPVARINENAPATHRKIGIDLRCGLICRSIQLRHKFESGNTGQEAVGRGLSS